MTSQEMPNRRAGLDAGEGSAGDVEVRPNAPATSEAASHLPLTAWGVAGIVAAGLLFIVLRLPLLWEPAVRLGWNSDAAIFGLMARAIAAGEQWPIFFWGQSYMGPLTSYLTALIGALSGSVGPHALRLAAMAEVLAGLLLFGLALRRGFGAASATIAALWLAAGPAYLFQFTVAPIGAEQAFLLGAAIFLVAVCTRLERWHHWFFFGLLSGLGWWINQGVFFAIAAAIAVRISGPMPWHFLRDALRPKARLLLQPEELGWRAPSRELRLVLLVAHAAILLLLILGVARAFSPAVPALFLFRPIAEPLVALAFFHLGLELIFGTRFRDALRSAAAWWRSAFSAAVGFLIGYAPVIIGGALGLYPPTYGFSAGFRSLDQVPRQMAIAGVDFWRLLGGAPTITGIIAGLVLLTALGAAAMRPAAPNIARATALLMVALCALFYIFSWRAHPGSMRYVVLALPPLYAVAAAEMLRWRRPLMLFAVFAVLLSLSWDRIGQVQAVRSAAAEQYDTFPGGFDPRPVLDRISQGGYRICYADYWIAYKLEWVSEQRVRFIPFRSYDRNRPRSRVLAAIDEPKCFVERSGAVRPFLSGEPKKSSP